MKMNTFDSNYAKKLKFEGEFDKLFHYCDTHSSEIEAANMLSDCYCTGLGAPYDLDKSYEIDCRLMSIGCFDAMARVAFSYLFENKHYNPEEGLRLLQKAAENSCGRAYRYLAFCYEDGVTVGQDYSRAAELYEEAISNGDDNSYAHLGNLYENGYGVEHSVRKAIYLYRKAVEQHCGIGYLYLAYCYESGNGVEESSEKAIELFGLGRKFGNTSSIIRLAEYYENGWDDIRTNYEKAFALYCEAAKKENKQALKHVGRCYLFGIGVNANKEEAISFFEKSIDAIKKKANYVNIDKWYVSIGELLDECKEYELGFKYYYIAADLGNIDGILNVAYDYHNGYGIEPNIEKAVLFYKKAFNIGSVLAAFNLGLLYFENNELFEDGIKLSVYYLNKSLEMNNDELSQNSTIEIYKTLISCYKKSENHEKLADCYQKLYELYQSMIDNSNGDAEYNLGLIFKDDASCFYNLEKAFDYFEQGTLKGNTQAAFQLSACYERGRGTSINLEKAFSIIATFQDVHENVKCYIGLLYQYGIGIKKSPETAVKIFESLLNSDDECIRTDASICLGLCYYHGEGVKSELEKAKQLLSQSEPFYNMYINASLGYSALSLAYRCYFEPGEGFGCYFKPDLKKSYDFLIKGYTETHESNYSYQIGKIYLTGSKSRGVKRNLKTAYKYFSESQSEGSLEEIAIIDYCGKARHTNEHLVVKHLTENANKRSSKANIYLGLCYYHGYSLKQNYERAIECFNTASQCNDSLSWFGLAFSALLKICNTENFVFSLDLAMEDLKIAANNNNAIQSLCSFIIDNDYLKLEAFPQAAALEISVLELYFNKNYSKHRFLTLFKGSLSLLFRTIILVLRYRKKESDIDLSNILSLFREQMKLQKDELERLTDEIQQRDQIIGNQHEIINTLRELDRKIDNITDITISIESSVQEVYRFITGELMQKIAYSKNELQQRLEGCTKDIIEANSMKESKIDTAPEIKKMLEEEHEKLISDFISSMSMYINDSIKNSNALFEDERKHLLTMFGSGWSKLQSASQTSLVSAGVLWKSCSDITKVDFDFSGVCISATSALESELKKWFFIGFQNYMVSQYGVPDASNWQQTFRDWPDQLLDISKKDYESKLRYNTNHGITDPITIDLKTEFYLGSLPYLFGVRSGVTRKSLLITRLNEYLKTIIIYNPDNARDLFLTPNSNIGMSLIDCCEVIRIQFRNPSAHVEVVDRTKAEECYHKVIGKIASYHYTHNVTGLLIEIMNLIQE